MPSKREQNCPYTYGPSVALYFEADRRSPEVIPPPRVNVWDQCLKFGEFRKENLQGQMTTTIFDETTVGQMMDYFRDHQNDLWMDSQHGVLRGKGQALCYHNALCMVTRGQVIRFESKGNVKKPVIEDLRRPDGTLPVNGLFAHRYQLTTLGLDPKEGLCVFKWISPLFDQPPHGYRLINLTATNDPFLDGVALAYENDATKEEPMKKMKRMDESKPHQPSEEAEKLQQMMEEAGCTPEDSPDEKLKKMSAYAKKMSEELDKQEENHALARRQMEEEHQDELKKALSKRKMEDKKPTSLDDLQAPPKEKPMSRKRFSDEDEQESTPQEKPMSKTRFSEEENQDVLSKEKGMSKKRFSDEEHKEDKALDEELPEKESSKEQAMARRIYRELGLPSDREMAREKMRELHSLPEHVFDLHKRLQKTEAERLEEKRLALRQEAQAFADEALSQKRWRPDHKGNEEATHKWLTQAYMRNPREAEEMLQPVGTFGLTTRSAMTRYTEGGTPYGVDGRKTWLSERSKGQGADLNQEALRIQAEQERATGKPFGYERALALAERRRPELLQAYTREVLQKENV